MKLEEIKKAVDDGRIVHHQSDAYVVQKDRIGQYLIKCTFNDYCIGLIWQDGTTMNGNEEEFYIEKIQTITTLTDVKNFIREIKEMDINFHPDDDIADYFTFRENLPKLSQAEAQRLSALLDDCFGVCDKEDVNIYDIVHEIITTKRDEIKDTFSSLLRKMGMDTPSNFNEILQYIYDDVCETADENNWNDADVVIAFRRWIESKIK